MITLDELREKASKIQKLRKKRENIFIDYTRIAEKKESELVECCKDYLLNHDQNYQQLIHTSYDSLQNDYVEVKVMDVDSTIFSCHTQKFETNLTRKGKLSCESSVQFPTVNILGATQYPSVYKGFISPFGETSLNVEEVKFGYALKTLPKKLVGKIDRQGNLLIRVFEYGFDFAVVPIPGSGKQYINKLEANIFGGNNKKKKDFFNNIYILENLVLDFRTSLD